MQQETRGYNNKFDAPHASFSGFSLQRYPRKSRCVVAEPILKRTGGGWATTTGDASFSAAMMVYLRYKTIENELRQDPSRLALSFRGTPAFEK